MGFFMKNNTLGTCETCQRDTVNDDKFCSRCIVNWLDDSDLDHDDYYECEEAGEFNFDQV